MILGVKGFLGSLVRERGNEAEGEKKEKKKKRDG